MNFKKFLSLLCTVTMLFSSTFCCKATKDYKVISFGNEHTGKTQIIRRLCGNPFEEECEQTVGAAFKQIHLNGDVKYNIWDVSGNNLYRNMSALYFRSSNIGVFVCDLNEQETINSDDATWIQSYIESSGNSNVILVGNKSDLIDEKELEAKKQTLIDLAIQHDIPEHEKRVVLVSAKTGDGIEDLKKLIIEHTPELTQDIPELEEVTTNLTNIHDNSTSKTKKYILGVFGGIVGTVGITALIAETYKYFFDKNKNLKDNTDTVSTNV